MIKKEKCYSCILIVDADNYKVEKKTACRSCWINHMDSIPLEKLGIPDFKNTIAI